MANEFPVLQTTVAYMAKKVRLPVVTENFFYPTEASVELEPEHPGEPNVIGTCRRAAYYRYMGGFTGDPYSEYTHWIFMTGKAVERELVETWKQMGLVIDNNLKFRSKERHISGEMDVILTDIYDKDHPILVELKTYYGYQATKDLKGAPKYGIVGKPKDPHLLQVLIYLHLHQHIFKYAKLIYMDKTCKDNFEFTITLTKEGDNTYPVINSVVNRRFSIEQIYERFDSLKDMTEKKELPPRDFQLEYSSDRIEREFEAGNIAKTRYEAFKKKGEPIGDFACNYCRYQTECYKKNEQT